VKILSTNSSFSKSFIPVPVQALTLAIGLVCSGGAAALPASDLYLTDQNAGPNESGILYKVDHVTGDRTVLSDFGDSGQGPIGQNPFGVTIEADGNILITDSAGGSDGRGAIFRVDPKTGNRSLVSDFGNSDQGPLGVNPEGITLDAGGDILVINEDHPNAGTAVNLFRIDPITGSRSIVSDFTDPAQGPLGVQVERIALETSGNLLVTDLSGGTSALGALYRVDPKTGKRTLLSDFGDTSQGSLGNGPEHLLIEPNGDVIVQDHFRANEAGDLLWRVNPVTGQRTIVSDFADSSQGVLGGGIEGLAREADGKLLATIENFGIHEKGALFRIDSKTGKREVLSDLGDSSQGPLGEDPVDVAVIYSYLGRAATILGTEGHDHLRGTKDDDVILGLGGNDEIEGRSGHDILVGGNGNDEIKAGKGGSIIDGGAGRDEIEGGSDADLLAGGPGRDELKGGKGNDWLRGGKGNDFLDGDKGIDFLDGGDGFDEGVNGETYLSVESVLSHESFHHADY
jgi:Ca2+-binding RTX toxin-like protein